MSLKKLTVLSCAKQETCNGMNPGGADPGQTLLTLRKTHPSKPRSEMETCKLTTEVKKYPRLHCTALTWKVFYVRSWAVSNTACKLMPPCNSLHVVFLLLRSNIVPHLFSFCKQNGILEWTTYFHIYTLLDIVAVPKEWEKHKYQGGRDMIQINLSRQKLDH